MIKEEEKLREYLSENGVAPFRITRLAEEFLTDWANNQVTSDEEKEWAFQRGFVSDKIRLFGLNDENWTDYISDLDFYNKDSYKNAWHSRWFDDKLSTWYMLYPFKDYMPVHYCYVQNSNLLSLDEDPELGPIDTYKKLISLVYKKRSIVFKACQGGHGAGFTQISAQGEIFYANKKAMSRETFINEYLPSLHNIIITDFIKPQESLAIITNGVTCVGRAVVVYCNGEAHITGANIRFASDSSENITDYEGTIYLGINLENGSLFNPMIRKDNGCTMAFVPCTYHPETGAGLNGKIEEWLNYISIFKNISLWFKSTPYLVIDFVPTDDGLKILEINSHGQQRVLQPFYPFFKNDWNKIVFHEAYIRTLARANNLRESERN